MRPPERHADKVSGKTAGCRRRGQQFGGNAALTQTVDTAPRGALVRVSTPTTTRAGAAATSRSAQAGPRCEAWAQGSSVT